MTPSIETRTSWITASMSLVILGVSFGAMWIAVVALKPIAAEVGGVRSVPSLATALAWFGAGLGGIGMGWFADRYGVRWTVLIGSVSIAIGLAISSLGQTWELYLGHGLFMGLLGNAGLNAPLYVYVSRWFDRRRGSALALIASGQYVSGAIWPPVAQHFVAAYGWRATYIGIGIFCALSLSALALLFRRRPPAVDAFAASSALRSPVRTSASSPRSPASVSSSAPSANRAFSDR